MNNPYYVIKFDDVYLDAQNPGGQTIHGRRMLLAQIPQNQSQSYEYTYQLAGRRSEWAFIFDDIIIQQIVSQINVYDKEDSKLLSDILGSYSIEYWSAHVGTVGVSPAWLPLVADKFGPYVLLDPNYSTPSGNKSNKVLRTLATGQSDITRHEAYTKAQGLNEFNSLTPSYTNSSNNQILKQMLEIVKRSIPEIPEGAKVVLYTGFPLNPNGIYNINNAYIAILIPVQEVIDGQVYNLDTINVITNEADQSQYHCIAVGCLTDSNSQYTRISEFTYLITTTCTDVVQVTNALEHYEKIEIPLSDLEELFDLSHSLIDTNTDLYYGLGGK